MKHNYFWALLVLITLAIPLGASSTLALAENPLAPIPITDSPAPPSGFGTGLVQLAAIPSLEQFAAALNTSNPNVVAGAYSPDLFALRVVQQVLNNPAYVSPMNGVVTQFGIATQYGTVGLLAHNYLAGAYFSKLSLGQEIDIVNGDGAIRRYAIANIRRFQALDPSSPYSNFIDFNSGGAQLSSTELFNQMYAGGNKVVLQTCIYANGNWSWGRLFVTATPQ